MSDRVNQGVSGQNITISGQNVAIGPDSRIEQNVFGGTFSAPLADLQRAIETADVPSDTRSALLVAHDEVAEELKADAPDRSKLLTKLSSLKELSVAVAPIARAVAALTQVVLLAF
jgi:hypothetical protein